MANLDTTKFIDVEALKLYHAGILEIIDGSVDTSGIHTVAWDGTSTHTIKFYTEKAPLTGAEVPVATVDLDGLYDNVDGLLTLMGSDALTTTSKTVTGAINELNSAVANVATKASSATVDNFASLTADGNIKDSGKKASDFASATDLGSVADITVETSAGVKATSAVAAINKLDSTLSGIGEAAEVIIDTATTTPGALKSYTVYQGAKDETHKIATIDIPKDFLVKSGSIVENPAGQPAGKYLELVINSVEGSATDEKIYINVADLVDAYTAQASASQIQVAISDQNVISARIVASSVTSTELADASVVTSKINNGAVTSSKLGASAVETAKIKDANVTLAKLESSVRTSLGKADSAVQPADIQVAIQADIDGIFQA